MGLECARCQSYFNHTLPSDDSALKRKKKAEFKANLKKPGERPKFEVDYKEFGEAQDAGRLGEWKEAKQREIVSEGYDDSFGQMDLGFFIEEHLYFSMYNELPPEDEIEFWPWHGFNLRGISMPDDKSPAPKAVRVEGVGWVGRIRKLENAGNRLADRSVLEQQSLAFREGQLDDRFAAVQGQMRMSGKVGVDNSENIALAPNAPRVAPKQIKQSLDDVKKAKDREAAKEAVAKASAKEKAKRRKERKKHGEPDYDSDEEATTTTRRSLRVAIDDELAGIMQLKKKTKGSAKPKEQSAPSADSQPSKGTKRKSSGKCDDGKDYRQRAESKRKVSSWNSLKTEISGLIDQFADEDIWSHTKLTDITGDKTRLAKLTDLNVVQELFQDPINGGLNAEGQQMMTEGAAYEGLLTAMQNAHETNLEKKATAKDKGTAESAEELKKKYSGTNRCIMVNEYEAKVGEITAVHGEVRYASIGIHMVAVGKLMEDTVKEGNMELATSLLDEDTAPEQALPRTMQAVSKRIGNEEMEKLKWILFFRAYVVLLWDKDMMVQFHQMLEHFQPKATGILKEHELLEVEASYTIS